jgi:hypothetical protein
MESLGPDGASEEGMSYWSYGLTNTFLAFESMKRVLSTTYGLAEQPGFRKTGMFPYMVSGPVGTATFGDDYLYNGKENRFLSHFWFSNYFKDAPMAKAHYDACVSVNANRTVKMNGWMDLLFYPKELLPIQRVLDLAHNSQQDKQLRIEVLRGNRCILCIYRVR